MRQLYKIVVIGDGGVGKTTTIHNIFQYLSKKFPSSSYKSCQDVAEPKAIERTKFIDFHTISFLVNTQKVVLQIWDLQGQRFPSNNAYTSLNPLDHITETVVKNSDFILLTYDSSDNATFNELFRAGGFYDLIKPFLQQKQNILLLASKTDLLTQDRKDPIVKLAIDIDFETISFNNTFLQNISVVSETIISKLLNSEENNHQINSQDEPVSLKVYR